MFQDTSEDIEIKIKEVICDIFNEFMNFKMDYLLNKLKMIFRNIVVNHDIYKSLEKEIEDLEQV